MKSYQKRQKIKLFAGELSASKYARFELSIFKYFKIKGQIVRKKVSSEIDIYCNNLVIILLIRMVTHSVWTHMQLLNQQ